MTLSRQHRAELKLVEDDRKGTCRRHITCPECGYERVSYGESNVRLCRACSGKLRRNGREIQCPGCGVTHYVTPSMEEKGIRYCSIGCANEHIVRKPPTSEARKKLSLARRGRKNPNYKDGKRANEGLSRRWGCRQKGETVCRNCGREAHHLHHVVPRSLSSKGKHDLRNGLPLCASCHFTWHRSPEPSIYRDIFTAEEWEFITTLIGPGWLDKRYPVRPEMELAA